MDNKDYVLEIYKVEADKYSKTREIHWKVNISIWTVLIVGIYAKSVSNFLINDTIIALCIYVLYLLIHCFFVIKMHGSINRSIMRMYNMAKYILEGNNHPIIWEDFEKKVKLVDSYWEILQILVTFCLIVIFHLIK